MKAPAGRDPSPRYERVPGVWAVRGSASADAPWPDGIDRVPVGELHAPDWRLSRAEHARWRESGWTFARSSKADALERALRDPEMARWQWARAYARGEDSVVLAQGDVLVLAPSSWSPKKIHLKLQEAGLDHVHAFQCHAGIVVARHRPHLDPYEICNRLRAEFGFAVAEPDFMVDVGLAWVPQDPEYGKQWSWRDPRRARGLEAARGGVAAEGAWDHTRGAGACLAVIDGGFDAGQPDFSVDSPVGSVGALHPASGRFEQDSNSQARRFVVGPVASQVAAQTQHGTKCAGRAGARANNGTQGCGLAPESDLLLIATNGVTSTSVMARAFEYCVNPQAESPNLEAGSGADAITCSLYTDFVTSWLAAFLMRMVLRYAGSTHGRGGRGAFIAWAVRNPTSSVDSDPIFRSPHVAAVAASGPEDRVVSQGHGKHLFCVAPGTTVYCNFAESVPGVPGTLRMDSGASFAAPLVAALAALCVSVRPTLKARTVRKLIAKYCNRIGGVSYGPFRRHHPHYGHGRIRADRTVAAARGFLAPPFF